MTKKSSNPKKETLARIQRTEAYAEKVRMMFAQTVNDILALNKTMPTLDEGVMYSFDGESLKKQKEVESLLRRLHSSATMAIQQGIKLEWEQANVECDNLIESAFGKKVLSNPKFSAWTNRNEAARDAFISRTEKGMNLSDRIWKPVRQLRDEMEVAMTVSIGEGESASSMSRKVRSYLNDPDLMFRRFRYKDDAGEWQRKWKKRIKDEETGKYRWIDYDRDDYKTGAGVYKSSAKNAMRVTRTETNIAYRRADNARWQDMDFVLGQRVQLSKSHPREDICDKLQGDYPKDFIFDGWHPQCFCFCTPILISEDEMAKVTEAALRGEKYEPQGKQIADYPDSFKDWIKEHSEAIAKARKRGTEPYFITNNAQVIDNILNPSEKELSILEKAKIRHEARTPEQEQAIKNAWEERKKKHALIKKAAGNVLNVAQDYGDVDFSKLQAAIDAGDLTKMQTVTKTVAQAVSAMKKQEDALASLIPDVHTWHKSVSMAELQSVYSAVEAKLAQWQGLSLEQQAKKLKFEWDDFLGGNMHNVQSKYKTWQVSQAAYKKKYEQVLDAIDWQKIDDVLKEAKAFKTKSTQYHDLISQLETVISAQDKANAQIIVTDMQAKRAALKKAADARKKKKGIAGTEFGDEVYTTERKNNAIWDKSDGQLADDTLHATAGNAWRAATELEKDKTYEYTHHYCNINEPLQGRHYIGSQTREQFTKRVDNITSYIDRNELPCDMWFTRGDDGMGVIASRIRFAGGTMPSDYQDLVGMVMQEGGFMSTGSRKGQGFGHKSVIMNIYAPKGTKAAYIEPISAYGNGTGRSWDGIEKFASFSTEHETLFQRGTKMRITKVYEADRKIYIDCEVIGQEIKDLSYIADSDIGY